MIVDKYIESEIGVGVGEFWLDEIYVILKVYWYFYNLYFQVFDMCDYVVYLLMVIEYVNDFYLRS